MLITIILDKFEAIELKSFIDHYYGQSEDLVISIEKTLKQLNGQLEN